MDEFFNEETAVKSLLTKEPIVIIDFGENMFWMVSIKNVQAIFK
jgi:hypothetical protein